MSFVHRGLRVAIGGILVVAFVVLSSFSSLTVNNRLNGAEPLLESREGDGQVKPVKLYGKLSVEVGEPLLYGEPDEDLPDELKIWRIAETERYPLKWLDYHHGSLVEVTGYIGTVPKLKPSKLIVPTGIQLAGKAD